MLDVFRFGRPTASLDPATDGLEEAVSRALTQLPVEEAGLLRRKYHEGASIRELAVGLNLSEEAVESRLSRARKALRDAVFLILKHDKS